MPPVVTAGLRLGAVAIEMTVERVTPLPADTRDIFGSTRERNIDQCRFEHRELRIGIRTVADPRQRVDVTATDPALLPRRARDRHLRGLASDLHPMMRLTRRHPKVRDQPTRRRTRTVDRPLDRRVELRDPPRELCLESRHLPPQLGQIVALHHTHDLGLRELIDRRPQLLHTAQRHAGSTRTYVRSLPENPTKPAANTATRRTR